MSAVPGDPSPQPPLGVATPAPPLVVFVPGIGPSKANSGARVAEIIAANLDAGPGTFTVESLATPSAHLTDAWRVKGAAGPHLDIAMLDYRPRFALPEPRGKGAWGALKRLTLDVTYVVRAAMIVTPARRRAKSRAARMQLTLGLLMCITLAVSTVITGLTVAWALGWGEDPGAPDGRLADALAIGLTAATTWLFSWARPRIAGAAALIKHFLDYAEGERHAAGVGRPFAQAIDDVLETDPGRRIDVVGYSMGALVALDFLFPRRSLREPTDTRYAAAVRSLVTIGCPVDFVRLYYPDYLDERARRSPELRWTNIFIAADILGSNLIDGDDFREDGDLRSIDGLQPVNHRYTDERLGIHNLFGNRGFLSHGGYWDDADSANCLHIAVQALA